MGIFKFDKTDGAHGKKPTPGGGPVQLPSPPSGPVGVPPKDTSTYTTLI
ncbi:hypothetical protein DFA_06118 [Cavenderia fasciculata]|uniref:Uncharacterized protein n=1 Tax=Cavenderia fasciculata TaxID=261658 RepID=F4PK56_CACFS|nr:uncharacterized protein DFA_06118 [Cavenderia fasciculata]EGG23980.1 hypothetical protein DFA_06118 [Cavenderia fasciculata]|eukprot:XP_004361831.1 hypothetical protein DFA_06118 [Cavenderia fasciculata]